MMFAYINLFKPKTVSINVKDLLHVLENEGWGYPEKGIYYSALDVLKQPKKKIYKQEIERIKSANLKYPIIVVDKHVIEGVHRLTRAYLEGKKNKHENI